MNLVCFSDEVKEIIAKGIIIEAFLLGISGKEDVCPLGVCCLVYFQVLFEVAVLAEFLVEFACGNLFQ